MSTSKLRHLPLEEQIAEYEKEIERIDMRIANGKAHQTELRRRIRILQKRMEQRDAQRDADIKAAWKEDAALARQRARAEREVEMCLRMNGKIF